jgi:predicted permease
MLREWIARVRFLISPKAYEEADEELQFHMEQQTRANIAQGMDEEEARRQAMIALGGVEGVRERMHAERPGIGFEILLQDLRYAFRQMQRAPGFALSVVIVLALGIGANAAMFTVLEGTLFRPLAYTKPGQLVQLNTFDPHGAPFWRRLADLLVWRERTHTLSQIAYYNARSSYLLSQNISQNSEQKVSAVVASSNLFATLGVTPSLGRAFTAEEQQPGKDGVIVLSDAVWRVQFQRNPAVLGSTIRIDDVPVTVIGVMPAGFSFPPENAAVQIWKPAPLNPVDLGRTFDAAPYEFIGRRKAGSSISDVAADLTAIQKQLLPLYANDLGPASVTAMDYRHSLNAQDQRTALLALLGSVALLWLIACANVASLMLARTASRRREMAVRSALGASRWRLVRQTFSESLLLGLMGGIVGLVFSQITLRLFRHGLAMQLGADLPLYPDGRVLFALLGLSVFTALLFGIVPSQFASRIAVEQALRQDNDQAGSGRNQHRLQRVLVVSELALTLVMLVACGLLLRTVFALKKVPLGFRTDHVFVIKPQLPGYKYWKLDAGTAVYKPLLERLKTIPGIQYAAITTVAPLDNSFNMSFTLSTDAHSNHLIRAVMRATGPEYQKVLGFGMARGRYFNAQDTPDSQPVAVVNRAFAKAYEIPGRDVESFSVNMSKGKEEKPRSFKVIGVVDDFHQMAIANPATPEIDLNAAQLLPTDWLYQPTIKSHAEIVLRSERDPRSLIPELNHVMQQMNPDLAGTEIQTMDQIVEDSMGSQLLAAHLLEGLGGLALLVALAGLYSLLAYLVMLRTRELGLRLALGAQRADILALVLRSAGILLVAGTGIGIGISLLTAHLLHSLLFGVRQYDLFTLVAAPALLLLVGTFAAWLPARRAAALEPMQALRTE